MQCKTCKEDTIGCPMEHMNCIDCTDKIVKQWVEEIKNLPKTKKKK